MSTSHGATDALVSDLKRVFGDRLHSIVTYGSHAEGDGGGAPITCLALVTSLTPLDLDACARAASGWRRHGLATPLILPEAEFRRSLDAFPLEYDEIIRAHAPLYGNDPFEGIGVNAEDLRRACETQVKSHLVHLREGFIEAANKPNEIGSLIASSAPAFSALLRNVARLHGAEAGDRTSVTREGARLARLPEHVVASIVALEQPQAVGATDAARLFPEYLAAVEQLAGFVDTWRQ